MPTMPAPDPAGVRPTHAVALGLHAAAVALIATVLLFRRAELAEHVGVLGALPGEATIIALVAVVSSVAACRVRAQPRIVLAVSSAVTGVGAALMGWTIEVGLFTIGGVLAAAGAGPAITLGRLVLAATDHDQARRRRMAEVWWGGAAAGAALGWVIEVPTDITASSLLWLAAVLAFLGTAGQIVGSRADGDAGVAVDASDAIGALDTPWPRRSVAAAFAGGAVVVGGAEPALGLLVGEWQRAPTQTAAVLAAAPVMAVVVAVVGPWYHRLGESTGSRRADAVGIQLIVVGACVFIGALSFTYIGLIASLLIAGAALLLAAAGVDSAAFASVTPPLRRRLAARQVLLAAAGAGLALILVELVVEGWSDQWRLAIVAVPAIPAGLRVRRYADPARDHTVSAQAPLRSTTPRRVADDPDRTVLAVEGLDVAYGSVQVLFGVDLEVREGQIVALLGTNGVGKTTLLRAISGLEPVLGGRIVYAGLDITRLRPTWRVGMGLHQIVGGGAVTGALTVDENLRLSTHLVDRDRRDHAVEAAFAAFPRLAERRQQLAGTLSGGEQQMLALAKAVMVQPRLLLIDEFSLGLAPAVIAELLPTVRRIAESGSAILLVEQSVNIALSVADHAYVMEKGEIGYHGAASDLRERPDLLRAAYLHGITEALRGVEAAR